LARALAKHVDGKKKAHQRRFLAWIKLPKCKVILRHSEFHHLE